MTKEKMQQYTFRISNANSTEMVVIIYEILLDYVAEAKTLAEAEDASGVKEACRKAKSCYQELLQSLDLAYEPAKTLEKLYWQGIRLLAKAQFQMTLTYRPNRVEETKQLLLQVEQMIVPIKDAYSKIANQNQNGPVMKNSQMVIAGLTYGKNSLTENMTDQGMNRGMLV